ncbi:MAG TPA: tetratricopeptide repeat protein [bacterium]|nr:tetratricopeptide repeat protein [bacterium]HQI47063.1 tetratricopeptide repeat protein [bacterium]HQJ65380.1 tetratricopeptide repeat protein [bacterium]
MPVSILTGKKYPEAKPQFERSIEIKRQASGDNIMDVAYDYYFLGLINFYDRQNEKAETYLKKSLYIQEKILGADNQDLINILRTLATFYSMQSDITSECNTLEKLIAIREKSPGNNQGVLADDLSRLAVLYYKQRNYMKAAPLFSRTLYMKEQKLGTENPELCHYYKNLAFCYQGLGKFDDAESLLNRSL